MDRIRESRSDQKADNESDQRPDQTEQIMEQEHRDQIMYQIREQIMGPGHKWYNIGPDQRQRKQNQIEKKDGNIKTCKNKDKICTYTSKCTADN